MSDQSTTLTALPAPASRHALALLRFPERGTDWVIVATATFSEPVSDMTERLAEVHRAVPMIGARLVDETWVSGDPAEVEHLDGEPMGSPQLDRPFDLSTQAPLRLVLGDDGRRLGIATHHAAFDGLGVLAIVRALAGGEMPQPIESPPAGTPTSILPVLGRLARPADRVAPTPGWWPRDAYAQADIELSGRGIAGRIAAASVVAIHRHNAESGAPLRKIGLTIPVGGPAGVGNVASYRRIDVKPDDPIANLVSAALKTTEEPGEQVNAPRLVMAALAPVVKRFSDTVLVSNLGRHAVDGIDRFDIFAVARGNSAVCIGATTIEGGPTSLTLRARDLSPSDARRILAETCDHLRADQA